MTNRIERTVELNAPVARVWRALTDHREFGQWFRVDLDGPFRPGALSTGRMTHPGSEGWPWRAVVERMEPERLFAFRWHDYDADSGLDIAEQPATSVEFRLERAPGGTLLTIVESGFEALPEARRVAVMRDNAEGWAIQTANIAAHVEARHAADAER